jgi:hypothetical protein
LRNVLLEALPTDTSPLQPVFKEMATRTVEPSATASPDAEAGEGRSQTACEREQMP